MFDLIARVLAWFYDFSSSYAISIVLLTFLIMLVLTPLTLKGTRSMMRIQQLQPELKRIQTKHKGDRQKINEETMALYQKHGANPLAGCLPTLVQLPVFIVLYRVINGMTKMGKDGVPDPSYLKKESLLYQRLVEDKGEMVSFGIDLSESAKDVIQANFVDGLPYLALVGITFVLSFGNAPSGGITKPGFANEAVKYVRALMTIAQRNIVCSDADGNGTIEEAELEILDKRGKWFEKLDISKSGHVSLEAFLAFFGAMKVTRGER